MLKNEECNYGITEKECLAVLLAIKHFRVYLDGRKFKVITDHSALAWLMNINEPTGRLARWSIYLQTYEFEIIHRAGKKHKNVDVLSRPIFTVQTRASSRLAENQNTEIQEISVNCEIDNVKATTDDEALDDSPKILDPYEDEALMHFLKFKRHLPGISKKTVQACQ